MFLDYNKAFDCVEWDCMEKALKWFGFKTDLIRCVKYIYTNNSSCIVNNGNISRFFKLSRGLRQGCPLSPYLFIILVEILATKIRNNNKIEGISIGNVTIKLNQYADDTFIVIRNKKVCLKELLGMIENFSKISGLTLNVDKTEVIKIGKTACCELVDKAWLKNEIRLLGIIIHKDNAKMLTANYACKLSKIENCIKIWKQRDLSLMGRIHIIKSLANSQLVYNWSNLPSPPESYYKELETLTYRFVWNSKVDRVKRSTLIAPLDEGGLEMIDARTQSKALKMRWIRSISEQYNAVNQDFWYVW